MAKPTVVIIGGGIAGVTAAQHLHEEFQTVLIDRKDYFEIPWCTPRLLVEPAQCERAIIPYKVFPKLQRIIQGNMTSLTERSATLASGEVLSFDYLILAVGATYYDITIQGQAPTFATAASRIAAYQGYHSALKDAHSVLVVGGGPVGVEIAGEIVNDLPGKQVTLVSSSAELLTGDNVPPRLGRTAKTYLESHGVKVILGDKVTRLADGGLQLASTGEPLDADVVYWAVGARPATAWLHSTPLAAALNPQGLIKVDPYLRVEGYKHIFAIGDCNNTPELKLGYLAGLQAELVANTLKSVLKGIETPDKAVWKKGQQSAMFVTLGRSTGVGFLFCAAAPGFVVKSLKSADMMIGMTRGKLGLPAK